MWTVQVLLPVSRLRPTVKGYGPQTPVMEADVPEEVKAYAIAELVRLRLHGLVRG